MKCLANIYDFNPAIQYGGAGWGSVSDDINTYARTGHYIALSWPTSNFIHFIFYGTELRLIDLFYTNRVNNVNVNIDGISYSYNPLLSCSFY